MKEYGIAEKEETATPGTHHVSKCKRSRRCLKKILNENLRTFVKKHLL